MPIQEYDNEGEVIEDIYLQAEEEYESSELSYLDNLEEEIRENLKEVIGAATSGKRKAVATVLITSLVEKIYMPNQDIRYHQDQQPSGYSGRTVDYKFITPFLKEQDFPSMKESGWLTRSLEQQHPYTLEYPGNITPESLKIAFLETLKSVEEDNKDPKKLLKAAFLLLIDWRKQHQIELSKPSNLSIKKALSLVSDHLKIEYSSGSSFLPVVMIYSAYEVLINELKRFEGKDLLPLKSHTAADSRAGALGDIEVSFAENPEDKFEALEIKHQQPITVSLVKDAYEKIKTKARLERYYILSTGGVEEDQKQDISEEIDTIKNKSGKEIIINGIIPALSYYLRLLSDPDKFVERYASNLEANNEINYEHRKSWNEVCGG